MRVDDHQRPQAIGIEPTRILFGNVSGYRNTPGAPAGIPILKFAARREGEMTYDLDDTPAAQFERYIAAIEERPRRQVKPVRWWHFAPLALAAVAIAAAWIWDVGRMLKMW